MLGGREVSLQVREKGAYFEHFTTARGGEFLRLEWTPKGALRVRTAGHGHGAYAGPGVERWDRELARCGSLRMFVDFWEMETYDSELRIAWTDWGLRNRGRFEMDIVSRSRLVRMGVTLASIAVGGVHQHHERESFEAAARRAGFHSARPREEPSKP